MQQSLLKTIAPAVALAALAGAASAQAFPWKTLSPTTSPTARERVGSATDGSTAYVYGGQVNTTTIGYDNLLAFDGVNWTELTAAGASCGPRSSPAMAWDGARGKLVVFGGKGDSLSWNNRLNDTWEWDAANGWVQMAPATVPDARWLLNGVYVPGLGMLFHGGNSVDSLGTTYTDNQTWVWNGTDWSVFAIGPVKQNGTLTYRPATNDLIYFGGNSAASPTKSDETWRLDVLTATWSLVPTATAPISSAATGGSGLVGATGYSIPSPGSWCCMAVKATGVAPARRPGSSMARTGPTPPGPERRTCATRPDSG